MTLDGAKTGKKPQVAMRKLTTLTVLPVPKVNILHVSLLARYCMLVAIQ